MQNASKIALSSFLLIVFVAFVAYQHFGTAGVGEVAYVGSPATQATNTPHPNPLPVRGEGADQAQTTTVVPATPISSPTLTTKPSTTSTSVPSAKPATIPTPVTAQTPTPTKVATGQYRDGSYTGDAADAYYGTIQVKVVVSGGKISDVQFLNYPQDRSNSVRVNTYAMPILKSETIRTQSANVDAVSGASFSSGAFKKSLSSALVQAKA